MARERIGRLVEGGEESDYLKGTRKNDIIYGYDGDDTIEGGRGVDLLHGGAGFDLFVFNDKHAGDVSFGRADEIADFTAEDTIDLGKTEILYFAGFDVLSPERSGFSIWEAQGDVYVTWNTFGAFHDVKLANFEGDYYNLLGQIRWYEDDYAGSVATMASIEPGETVTGEIEVDLDADWFRVELEEGLLYSFDLQGEADGGGTLQDPYLVLYDEFGDYVADGYEALVFVADAPGTYFISAEAFDSMGSYALTAAAGPYVDDFGDDATTAGAIASGETVTGVIGVPFDQDWFCIELEEGETYTIDLRGASSGLGSLPDPVLRLLDDEGQELAANDDANGLDSQIVYTAESTGIYFIAVGEFDFGVGTYDLSVSDPGGDLLFG